MGYKLNDLIDIFKSLDALSLKFVVIGNTSILYALGERLFDDDLDLFIYEGSSMAVEDELRALASKKRWDIGQTDMGTPSIIYKVRDEEVIIELYENFYDFYIPIEFAEDARVMNIDGYYLKMLTPEQYLVLKARSGVEGVVEELAIYINLLKRKKLNISLNSIEKYASLFEDDKAQIIGRLRKSGLSI